jgi:membrane-associated phospholipid phosphatase
MSRRVLLVVASYAVLALVVVGWGWLLTHSLQGSIEGPDDDASRWFAGQRTSWLDPVSDVGTLLGETPVGLAVGAVVALVLGGIMLRSLAAVLLVLLANAGDGGIYWLGSNADPRDRPPVHILDSGLVPDHSFPSGHVGTAVAVYGGAALLLALWLRRRGPVTGLGRVLVVLLACVPLFVAVSRLYQGAHHLTDVGTSLVYGAIWLGVLCLALPLGSKRSEAVVPRSPRGHADAPVPHR